MGRRAREPRPETRFVPTIDDDEPVAEGEGAPAPADEPSAIDYTEDLNNDPSIPDEDAPPDDGDLGGDDFGGDGGFGESDDDLFRTTGTGGAPDPFNTFAGRRVQPPAAPARKNEPASIWAMSRQRAEVEQLRVWKIEDGREIEIGECDSRIDSAGFIRRFLDFMPRNGEMPRRFVLRPVVRGSPSMADTFEFGPIDPKHTTLQALREGANQGLSDAQMRKIEAGARAASPGGIDTEIIKVVRDSGAETNRLLYGLLKAAEVREVERARMEREKEAAREAADREERRRRAEAEELLHKQRLEVATSTTRATEALAERAMQADREAAEARIKSIEASNAILMQQQRGMAESQMQQQKAMAEGQVSFLATMFTQQQTMAQMQLERERADAAARIERERLATQERIAEMQRMALERAAEDRRLADERRAMEDRDRRERAERAEREENLRLAREREERERRERDDRDRRDREKEERDRRDREERERREERARLDREAEERRRAYEEKLLQLERERISSLKTESPQGLITQVTTIAAALGIDVKSVIGGLLAPKDDDDGGAGAIAEVLPTAIEQGGKFLTGAIQAGVDYMKTKDTNATRTREAAILAASSAPPIQQAPAYPQIPAYAYPGYAPGYPPPPAYPPPPPPQDAPPVPPGAPAVQAPQTPPVPPGVPAQPGGPVYPGDMPVTEPPRYVSTLPITTQRDARQAIQRLAEQFQREPEDRWLELLQAMNVNEPAMYKFFQDMSVIGALTDCEIPRPLVERILAHPAIGMLSALGIPLDK